MLMVSPASQVCIWSGGESRQPRADNRALYGHVRDCQGVLAACSYWSQQHPVARPQAAVAAERGRDRDVGLAGMVSMPSGRLPASPARR